MRAYATGVAKDAEISLIASHTFLPHGDTPGVSSKGRVDRICRGPAAVFKLDSEQCRIPELYRNDRVRLRQSIAGRLERNHSQRRLMAVMHVTACP